MAYNTEVDLKLSDRVCVTISANIDNGYIGGHYRHWVEDWRVSFVSKRNNERSRKRLQRHIENTLGSGYVEEYVLKEEGLD